MAATPRRGPAPTWPGALGALVVAGTVTWLAGPAGLVVAGLVAVAWWRLPAPYAVAAGHVAALPVLPTPLAPAAVAALEAGFLGVLGGAAVRGHDRPATLAVLGLGAVVLGAVAWGGWHAWSPRWLAGAAVAAAVAAASYGLHRYSVVSLAERGVTPRP